MRDMPLNDREGYININGRWIKVPAVDIGSPALLGCPMKESTSQMPTDLILMDGTGLIVRLRDAD